MSNPLPLMSKGEEKQIDRGSIGLLVDVFPSMPKGETVGNVVIDGKGDEKGGAPETSAKEQRKQKGGSKDNKKRSKEQHQSRSRG